MTYHNDDLEKLARSMATEMVQNHLDDQSLHLYLQRVLDNIPLTPSQADQQNQRAEAVEEMQRSLIDTLPLRIRSPMRIYLEEYKLQGYPSEQRKIRRVMENYLLRVQPGITKQEIRRLTQDYKANIEENAPKRSPWEHMGCLVYLVGYYVFAMAVPLITTLMVIPLFIVQALFPGNLAARGGVILVLSGLMYLWSRRAKLPRFVGFALILVILISATLIWLLIDTNALFVD